MASKGLKGKGVRIITLAIGTDIELQELVAFSSDPSLIYRAEDFGTLKTVVRSIEDAICKGRFLEPLGKKFLSCRFPAKVYRFVLQSTELSGCGTFHNILRHQKTPVNTNQSTNETLGRKRN